ncbi:MAG TPA: methyltransferase domain-containing protein, partial [Methanothrix sp.]|nr:methyltransferase domain-containing protein [Methanothrix sp.]
MRELIKHFVNICAKSLPIIEPIYEFGSHQVPGQEGFADLRPIFPDMEYVGSDMREGVGVDRVLNLHHIDLPDESVGTVLCLDTLEHVEYPRRAMEEIRRILKPDGLVVISSVMNFPIHDYPNDYWRFTPEAFNILLQDFNRHYSDFAGDEQFPHTVIGVAFKGDIPEEILEIFQQEIKVWKELCRGEDEGPENQVSGADKDLPSPPSPSPSSSSSPSPAQHFEPPSSKRYEPASLINLEDKNDSHSLIVELAGTNNTILEVGTSTGYLTRILKVRGNRVIGIEVDGEAAKIAE